MVPNPRPMYAGDARRERGRDTAAVDSAVRELAALFRSRV